MFQLEIAYPFYLDNSSLTQTLSMRLTVSIQLKVYDRHGIKWTTHTLVRWQTQKIGQERQRPRPPHAPPRNCRRRLREMARKGRSTRAA